MATLKEFQATDVEGILQAVNEDGACIAHNVLDTALCDSLLEDFAPHLEAMDWGLDELGYRDEAICSSTCNGLDARLGSVEEPRTMCSFALVESFVVCRLDFPIRSMITSD